MRGCRMYRGPALGGLWVCLAIAVPLAAPAAEVDASRYMSPDEVMPGMKGFGRTVLRGTEIETFDFEIISVMRNAWYAKQDVILIRCKGLNLEHSGIIGGMSGSPCYVREDTGRERMIGAVAFGWSFNKDPICGVQPITQMLPLLEVRSPENRPKGPTTAPSSGPSADASGMGGRGVSAGELLARVWDEPIEPGSRFSVFNDELRAGGTKNLPIREDVVGRLSPLSTPLMISGISEQSLSRLRPWCERLGFEPVVSGGATDAVKNTAEDVVLAPGSVICVPILTGDLQMDALGTCTEVVGDKVLGFGHHLFGKGFVELPMATGMVHTVIPSVMRSNKLGAALRTVGTLWGDEATAIFGVRGTVPPLAGLEVTVHDIRGKQIYRYQAAREREVAAMSLSIAVNESIFSHSMIPDEHVVKYSVAIDFEGLGTFRTDNYTSQMGTSGVSGDVLFPVMAITNTPFGQVSVTGAKVDVTIESGAQAANLDHAQLPRNVYKPGETVTVQVRWMHYRRQPTYTDATYQLALPADLPDGEYELIVGSAQSHLSAYRRDKPHLWRVENLKDMLRVMNLIGSFPENRFYMHLKLDTGGVAIGRMELPQLPSYRQKIIADAGRNDAAAFSDFLLVQHETGFAINGERTFNIRVSKTDEY